MATISNFFYLFLFTFTLFSQATSDHGFTTSLFHRDSPISPLHNPSLTHYDRLNNSLRRSISRAIALFDRATTANFQSPIAPGSGEYVMSAAIGTPPMAYVAVIDTGSDLVWTQCLPCRNCYNQSLPIFKPLQSSSFKHVPCTSQMCHAINVVACGDHEICNYSYTYADQTYSKGELGLDKITLGSSSVNTVIGCGHESAGGFGVASGVIGLGSGKLSLISQMNQNYAVNRRFSYCLPTALSRGKGQINFGKNAVVSGLGVVSTPMLSKKPNLLYYMMTLKAVSVGNERHAVDKSAVQGNMIIDTGTTLTYLPKEVYDGVVSSLVNVVRAKRVEDPGRFFRLCFDSVGLDVPIITGHFDGGADLHLLPVNTFLKVADNVSCLTLTPSSPSDPFGIWGNLAQTNFLIGYDLKLRKLSFKPTVCA